MDIEIIQEAIKTLKRKDSVDSIMSFEVDSDAMYEAIKRLRDEFHFEALADIASIDMGEDKTEYRFGAVYHLYSHSKKCYIRIRSMAQDIDEPKLASICSIYKGADWHEREAFDLMGIVFVGHPNLHRILMWEEYPYHPLRKDFPLAGKEVPLPDTFEGSDTTFEIKECGLEGGPFCSSGNETAFVKDKEPRSKQVL